MWQYSVTGNALMNTYTLWWPYDKVGFGPGYGITPQGHNLPLAWLNTRFSLWVGYHDLFGWGRFSWIFLPVGLVAVVIKRNWRGMMVSMVFICLFVAYLAYWVSSWLLGPRYFYEGLYSLTLLSALGIAFPAGWPIQPGEAWKSFSGWKRFRPLVMTALWVVLLSTNLAFYTPIRMDTLHGLFGMERADLEVHSAQVQGLAPSLIIVHADLWMDYGVLLDLETLIWIPLLSSPGVAIPRLTQRWSLIIRSEKSFITIRKTPTAFTLPRGRPMIDFHRDAWLRSQDR